MLSLTLNPTSNLQMSEIESELWRRVKEDMDGEAADTLGDMYYMGNGVKQSDAMAYQVYEMGAERGNRNCMVSCGLLRYKGEGTDKDKGLALQYYKRAAQAGSVIACHNVARSFELANNDQMAVFWYQKAVESKDDDPQCDECRQHCKEWLENRLAACLSTA